MRYVIIGTGNIARTYVSAVDKLDGQEIVGFVSRSPRRPSFVEGNVDVAETLDEISAPFDAVILATPPGLHHKGAAAAAAQGKHVLSEKPLDVTRANMDAMIDACRQAGVKLAVAYQRRMSPDNQALKKVLDDEGLGRLYAADLSVKFYRDQSYYDSAPYRGTLVEDGGGPFVQQASHNIDLYSWFFGTPKQVVSMMGTLAHDIEVEDHGAALLRHDDGMIGTIVASTLAKPGFAARLEVHGERGSVVAENDRITTWEVDGVANPSTEPAGAIHSGASVSVEDTFGHEAILNDFVEAVRDDRDPMVTGESAREASRLILCIYEGAV
ncbi:MAG: Gfo/Idh/MocA family oxidoreductase [Rhodothermales bacterium]